MSAGNPCSEHHEGMENVRNSAEAVTSTDDINGRYKLTSGHIPSTILDQMK